MAEETNSSDQAGIKAVGAYLRFLRETAGISVAEIADKVNIDPSQIWRIEKGKSDPRSSILFRFVKAVNGNLDDIALLINNSNATSADGENIARLRVSLNQ